MRGVVSLSDGVDIAITTNAMVRYQQASGETVLAAFSGLDDGGLDFVRLRCLIWAVLIDRSKSEDDVGDLIDEIGFKKVSLKLVEAVQSAFPDTQPGNVQESPET